MILKKIVAIALIVSLSSICLIFIGGIIVSSTNNEKGITEANQSDSKSTESNSSNNQNTSVSTEQAESAQNAQTNNSNCGTVGSSCTTTQIATHNSPNDCWVIYNSSYYDVTSFVDKHDGGSGAFTSSTCGQDISRYLSGSTRSGTDVNRSYKHSTSAYNTLMLYKVGPVVN